ncbi:MAG: methionine synthase [Bacteroidales bacterium]|nr:methionine synthase [Bacteroidales bacterium]
MTLREAFSRRLMLLDGGMGSLLMQGNNDALSLTQPDLILDIHRRYVAAGADVLTTNTFSAQRVSQHEYHLEDRIADINRAGVRLARQAADECQERKVYVVGDVGPTSKMLSMSEDVNDPAARSITYDELESAYHEQIYVLLQEGVDGVLIETVFDTLNAKAALSAMARAKDELEQETGVRPAAEVLLSMTVSDASGRTLSGQTVEAFVCSVAHASPLSVGLNCGLGAEGMIPYLEQMSACADCYVTCHPNAGLPNQFGGYDDTPADMVRQMQPMLDRHLVNMIGGCCGTTPEHTRAMRDMIDALPADYEVRTPAVLPTALRLAGLEPLVAPSDLFVRVGERCNVAGSRKFLRLINEKKYDEALDIARKQVEDGAMVIDVNMDDGLLDAEHEMQTFLNLLASDPSVSRVPIMVDSSRFEVIVAGLKSCQGKCIVNSISLKMGEEEFLARARTVKRLGAAVIAMCFDEEGQATDYERRIRICQRMYDLLTREAGFAPSDIIFDPNVLTIATGMAEHAAYASDFIRATGWVQEHLPGTRVSGGLSNLSFAFRGNNYLREAMHSVFLHHAIPQGMGMAILNPATQVAYDTIAPDLQQAISDVVLNTSAEASERLIEMAQQLLADKPSAQTASKKVEVPSSPEARLQLALQKGDTSTLNADLQMLLDRGDSPLAIISGPLMDGLNEVGRLFGEGKMFLPQVVKSARTMKRAVEYLDPYIKAMQGDGADAGSAGSSRGKIVIATVKGDVHDIGKNIVAVIMACNGFEVIDLGVMVPAETIIEAAQREHADIISLSGLITPSLEEMCTVARAMQDAGMHIPLMVGGATTSPIYTAVKIAPCYDGPVFHVRDAATNPGLAMRLLDPATHDEVVAANLQEQQRIREQQQQREALDQAQQQTSRSLGEATPLERRLLVDWSTQVMPDAPYLGARILPPLPVREVVPLIDWLYFYWPWRVKEDSEEGRKLRADADALLQTMLDDPEYDLRCAQAFYPAGGMDDHIHIVLRSDSHPSDCPCCRTTVDIPTPRQQRLSGQCLSLCDYLPPCGLLAEPKGRIGAFACTVSETFVRRLEQLKSAQGGSDYDVLLLQTVGDRLAEAAAEYLSRRLLADNQWGGIRPAVGYPALPDQHSIFLIDKLVDFKSVGISLTENGAMYPQASVSGLYFAYPDAQYFSVK